MAQGIESLIEEAKASGLPPVIAAYTGLIRAWGKRKSLVNVRQALIDMQEDGVAPNELHYRAAVVAHGQCLRPYEAQVHCTDSILSLNLHGTDCLATQYLQHILLRAPQLNDTCMQVCIQCTLYMCCTLKGYQAYLASAGLSIQFLLLGNLNLQVV